MELETINKLTMTSKEIAGLTNKQHHHVCRDIVHMLKSLDIDNSPFMASHKNHLNQSVTSYNLPKEETLILVSGYNVGMRARIIKRWLELEENNLPEIPQSFADALLLAGKLEKEKEQALLLIEEQKPKVALAESIEATEDCISFKKMADIHFNFGRNTLMKKLRDGAVLTSNNSPYRRYIDQGLFEVDEKNINGRLISTTFITPKGQIWIMDNLKRLNI